jgi:2-polyprenyl-3-methyl-5-hydroxy-6-metoxy-1,4-benzoquinol methylase
MTAGDDAFSADVGRFGSYAYTKGTLSGDLSNARISKSILGLTDFRGKTVIDIGCGDGTYSRELAQAGAASVLAIDPVQNAIEQAKAKYADMPNLYFDCVDLYAMEPKPEPAYDIAVLRGVLHHLPDLEGGIRIACALARHIVVMEPNGYNPVLKVIEKTSRYHIEHREQSFPPARLRRLFRRYGAPVTRQEYVGLVPFFCPDKFARILKRIEPMMEALPALRAIACGQYMFLAERRGGRA